MNKVRTQLMLCGGTGCQASDSVAFQEVLQKELERQDLADEIKIIETGCNGFCAVGPVMLVQPEGIFYQKLKPKDVPHLVEDSVIRPAQKKDAIISPGKILFPGPRILVIECRYGCKRDNRISSGHKRPNHQPVAGHDPDLGFGGAFS